MNAIHPVRAALLACLGAMAVANACAQAAAAPVTASPATPAALPAAPPLAEPPAATERGEPAVKYTVIEDEGSRIDELRVRGQTQSITVTPKVGGKALGNRPYQIITPAGSQDLQEAPNGVRGAAGKRVWHVLSF